MIYTDQQLRTLIEKLLNLPAETERFDFKNIQKLEDIETSEIGKYFSALSNEANLKNQPFGRLIFGIEDKTRKIVGTSYREGKRKKLDDLKKDIANMCNVSFVQIYELTIEGKRLIIFQIPPALPWIPTKCNGHKRWRNGEHISALDDAKDSTIKSQKTSIDRTEGIIEGMTIDDIDLDALEIARQGYLKKHPDLDKENILKWDTETFLKKSRMLIGKKFTRACGILLGKDESISQYFPRLEMSRILKDASGAMLAHEHFKPPFVKNANIILSKIRILPQRFLPQHSLMPIEIPSYDGWILRELLANAICHQNYTLKGRIGIQEFPDYILISNVGNFFAGNIESVVKQEDFMPASYRNPCLKDAMNEIGMIEHAGSGLRKVFLTQKERYMPMPTDFSTDTEVKIRLEGRIIDENYTKLLYTHQTLILDKVIDLDKVQKGKTIPLETAQQLRKHGLLEWRYPHCHISAEVADKLERKSEYIKQRGFKDRHYKEMILEYLDKFWSISRKEIDSLLMNILPAVLNDNQKKSKINNLLYAMSKKEKSIINIGNKRASQRKLRNK